VTPEASYPPLPSTSSTAGRVHDELSAKPAAVGCSGQLDRAEWASIPTPSPGGDPGRRSHPTPLVMGAGRTIDPPQISSDSYRAFIGGVCRQSAKLNGRVTRGGTEAASG
jgi:hypothetical protein